MKEIQLTRGMVAIVDDADYERLAKHKWCYATAGYATRRANNQIVYMHREIAGARQGQYVDHINLNKLDNRRSNLRLCTKQGNQHNQRSRGGSSRYKGVSLRSDTNRYTAYITVDYKKINLGCYDDEVAAALAYNAAAMKYHGEFACLNEIENAPVAA